MKRFQAIILLLAFTAGCFRSVHPIYTTGDVVFDPALIGEWAAETETWTVSRAGENSYRIVHADDTGRSAVFLGHLVEIEGYRFIDLLPVKTELRATHLHYDALLPLHTVALVVRTAPTPQFATFRGDWFNEYLRAHPDGLRHERVGNEIVITASTREIQAFLVRHADNREALDVPAPWRRAMATTIQGSHGRTARRSRPAGRSGARLDYSPQRQPPTSLTSLFASAGPLLPHS